MIYFPHSPLNYLQQQKSKITTEEVIQKFINISLSLHYDVWETHCNLIHNTLGLLSFKTTQY